MRAAAQRARARQNNAKCRASKHEICCASIQRHAMNRCHYTAQQQLLDYCQRAIHASARGRCEMKVKCVCARHAHAGAVRECARVWMDGVHYMACHGAACTAIPRKTCDASSMRRRCRGNGGSVRAQRVKRGDTSTEVCRRATPVRGSAQRRARNGWREGR